MSKGIRTQRKKENRKEVLPEIHTDEEYEARLHRMLERRKAEKQRQIQRRKIVRCLPFAGMIILALVLVGIGVGRLADIIQTRSFQSSVEKMVKEGAIQAQKQPVMSGTDIEKFSSSTAMEGWQTSEQGKWYRNDDGTIYQNGWQEIDGQENNVKATFYMLGQNVEKYPDIVKRMKDLGMELANHTYDHKDLTKLTEDQISEEINKTSSLIQDAAGELPDTLRPPGGSYNDQVQELAGMPIVKWSIDTKDWKTKSEDATYQCVIDNVQDGSVVLMHDIHEWSVDAAIRLIPDLLEEGYKLVTVQELAEAKGITLGDGQIYEFFGEGTQMVE